MFDTPCWTATAAKAERSEVTRAKLDEGWGVGFGRGAGRLCDLFLTFELIGFIIGFGACVLWFPAAQSLGLIPFRKTQSAPLL